MIQTPAFKSKLVSTLVSKDLTKAPFNPYTRTFVFDFTLATTMLFLQAYTFTDELALYLLVPSAVSAAINAGIGSQLSEPFVKLKVVIAVPSVNVGTDNHVAQVARLAALFTPEFSIVPYSYILGDSPLKELFQPIGIIRDWFR
jgi:hypothetical protein